MNSSNSSNQTPNNLMIQPPPPPPILSRNYSSNLKLSAKRFRNLDKFIEDQQNTDFYVCILFKQLNYNSFTLKLMFLFFL